jgi:lysophospholipase L1-like esterase
MKHLSVLSAPALVISLALALHSHAEAPATKPAAPVPAKPAPAKPASNISEPADFPSPKKDKEGHVNPGFQAAHESFLKRGKEPVGLLFLGDSITAGWGKAKPIWEERYAKHQAANFGISGDRTQHVLWRIANGELDVIKPRVLVLMIGTNNSAYPIEEIIKADTKIVSEIHKKLPETKIMLLGIFPRGAEASNPMRAKLKTVNAALAKLDDGKLTRYLDIGAKFLDESGNIPKEIMPDALHPSADGYKIWADAIQPLLDEMMK